MFRLPISPLLLIALTVIALLAGCGKRAEDPAPSAASDAKPSVTMPPEGAALVVGVVDDLALAEAIGNLQGAWRGLTDSAYEVRIIDRATFTDDPAAALADCDIIVASDRDQGTISSVAEVQRWTAEKLVELGDDWADVFPTVRDRVAAWGTSYPGVSFGSPVLLCYLRQDLLESEGIRAPSTWEDYQDAIEKLDGSVAVELPAIEPLGPGDAAITFLARAAAYARHRDNFSTLFNIETMEPLIDAPPFVRALTELDEAHQSSVDPGVLESTSPWDCSVDDARRAFWEGRCAMAVTYPTAAAELESVDDAPTGVAFAPLPGSWERFNVSDAQWSERDATSDRAHVPLVGIAGRLGVVSGQSTWPEASRRLLAWLSGPEWGTEVGSVSSLTTLYRRSQAANASKWLESPAREHTTSFLAALEVSLDAPVSINAPRIPGHAEYMAVLDAAVRRVAFDGAPPEAALSAVADQWRQITERRGLENQRAAYRASVGLPE